MAFGPRRALLHHPQRLLHHRLDRTRPGSPSRERASHDGRAYGLTLSQGQAATRVSQERLPPARRGGVRRGAAEPLVRPGSVHGGTGELSRSQRRHRPRPRRLRAAGGRDSQSGHPPGPDGQREPLGQRPDLSSARAGPAGRGVRPQDPAAAATRGGRRRGGRPSIGPRTAALRHPAAGLRGVDAGVHRVGAAGQPAELLYGPAGITGFRRRRRGVAGLQRSRGGGEHDGLRGPGGPC